jgi:hypothetical protein
VGLTIAALSFAYRDSGARRASGALIIGAYLVFLGSLLATAHSVAPSAALTTAPALIVAAGCAAGLLRRPGRSGPR